MRCGKLWITYLIRFILVVFHIHPSYLFIFDLDPNSLLQKYDVSSIIQRECNEYTRVLTSEINMFLHSPTTDTETIFPTIRFPVIKELFLKFNSIHTSEADVERIFSYAGRYFFSIFKLPMFL